MVVTPVVGLARGMQAAAQKRARMIALPTTNPRSVPSRG